MPELLDCEYCGEPIPKGSKGWPTYYKNRKYCSRSCSAKAQSQKKVVECANCGKEIKRSPSHISDTNYCSKECRSLDKTEEVECEICGETIRKAKSDLVNGRTGERYEHQFCSRECFYEWFGSDTEQDQGRRSPEDREWKQKVIEKDGFECRLCGSDRNLEAHHIKPASENPDLRHDVENGICVCHECHYYKIHGGRPNFSHGQYATELDRGPVQLELPV